MGVGQYKQPVQRLWKHLIAIRCDFKFFVPDRLLPEVSPVILGALTLFVAEKQKTTIPLSAEVH